jgi:hypothetical protein
VIFSATGSCEAAPHWAARLSEREIQNSQPCPLEQVSVTPPGTLRCAEQDRERVQTVCPPWPGIRAESPIVQNPARLGEPHPTRATRKSAPLQRAQARAEALRVQPRKNGNFLLTSLSCLVLPAIPELGRQRHIRIEASGHVGRAWRQEQVPAGYCNHGGVSKVHDRELPNGHASANQTAIRRRRGGPKWALNESVTVGPVAGGRKQPAPHQDRARREESRAASSLSPGRLVSQAITGGAGNESRNSE